MSALPPRRDGKPFVDVLNSKGIIPGIKVDTGLKPLLCAPGENWCTGLDSLNDRAGKSAPESDWAAQRPPRREGLCGWWAAAGRELCLVQSIW